MIPVIECRFCRERYENVLPEEIGARCKNCRMPLFERPPRRRPGYDLGPCAVHADVEAYGKCRACGKLMCNVCRTRWHDQLLCPTCLSGILDGSEANPRDQNASGRMATWSATFSFAGWLMLLCALIPLGVMYSRAASTGLRTFGAVLFLGSVIPACLAIGQAIGVIRQRSERMKLALGSLACSGAQVGIVVGILVLNLWFN